MGKTTIDDLARIREKYRHTFAVRQGVGRVKVTVHMGPCGINAGARNILTAVMKEIESRHLADVIVTSAGCAGHCDQEPMITVDAVTGPAPTKYVLMTPDKVKKIFDSHIVDGQVVKEFTLPVGK